MGKTKKALVAVCASAIMVGALPVTASAAPYSFNLNMPDYFVGGMRSTDYQQKTSDSTPYVDPKITTLPTAYFLSVEQMSRYNATDVVTISNGVKHNFSWQSNYGGLGGLYCLSAYPNMTGTWDAYNTRGTWSN